MEMGVIIIGSIILILICTIIAIYDNNKNAKFDVGIFFGIVLSILMVVEVVLLSAILEDPKPTAIDVYQDKTTLEYTIRDGVKIDSVVVFNNEIS
jgi:hypothetical protein